ncbi:hypothetical protein, partial [Streptomyces justiciae]
MSDVEVRFTANYMEDAPDSINAVRQALRLPVPFLPPCSELVVSPGVLFPDPVSAPLDVTFADSDGVKWIRTKGALERRGTPEGHGTAAQLQAKYGGSTLLDVLDAKPAVKKLEPYTA